MKFTTRLELHFQTTRLVEGASHGHGRPSQTGFSPSMTARSRALRWGPLPKHPLQITMRTPKEPAFKFELLPLHSPLLRQSLLVSFPPLIDMLKFSGYSYLIRGQPLEIRRFNGQTSAPTHSKREKIITTLEVDTTSPIYLRSLRPLRKSRVKSPNTKLK